MGIGRRVVLHGFEILDIAQIVQHHKTQLGAVVQNLRHVEHLEQLLHAHIRCSLHFFGRRIHADNAAAVSEHGAEIAAEIRIGSGKGQLERLVRITLGQPVF